jgi:hypothetical protein
MEENRVCDGGVYTKLTWPNFYTTSKFINMYSGCFEWKRVCDGDFFEDVDDHDMTPVTEEINLAPFENTDPIVG